MNVRQPESGESSAPDKEKSTALVVIEPQPDKLERRGHPGFLQRLIYLFRPQSGSVRESLQTALNAHSESDKTISTDERAMLSNILRLQGMRVDDVMVPRADVESCEIKTTLGELLKLFKTSGHSRMPVFSETLDDPRGMVHIRDVVAHLITTAEKRPRRRRKTGLDSAKKAMSNNGALSAIADIDLGRVDLTKTIEELKLTREVLFVPASMFASDLMGRMQTQRIQMALVIDEYGGTDGLVSLEDIVEIVVGNIEDEHDDVDVLIETLSEGVYIVDARYELEEAAKLLGSEFLAKAQEEDGDVDTIGGLIFSILGHVPVRGEVIPSFCDYELEVLDADPRRIRRVKISRARHAARRRQTRRETNAGAEETSPQPTE